VSGGKAVAASLLAGMQELQPREDLKENFIYLFTFYNISNAAILIPIFIYMF
jgi:hypothetical protein